MNASLASLEGVWLCRHLDFRFPSVRTVKEQVTGILSLGRLGRGGWRPRAAGGAVAPVLGGQAEGGACAGLKEDLGVCLLQSDCMLKEGKSPGSV